MDQIEEGRNSILVPAEQPSLGNSEKNSGLEKDTVILVEPGKSHDSKPENGVKEGGGYTSYAVSRISPHAVGKKGCGSAQF